MSVISYPIPAYSNVPIEPWYAPGRFVISSISLGQTTTITTTTDMNYVIGQLVRLIIPPTFGTRQLNEQQGYVISIHAANQVTLAIDSSFYDAFVSSSSPTKAQILAIGDVNQGTVNASGRTSNGTYVPGAFIDTSPVTAY